MAQHRLEEQRKVCSDSTVVPCFERRTKKIDVESSITQSSGQPPVIYELSLILYSFFYIRNLSTHIALKVSVSYKEFLIKKSVLPDNFRSKFMGTRSRTIDVDYRGLTLFFERERSGRRLFFERNEGAKTFLLQHFEKSKFQFSRKLEELVYETSNFKEELVSYDRF